MKKNIGLDYRAVKAGPSGEGIRKGQIGLLDREEEKGHKKEGGQRPEKGYTRDNHQFSVVLLSVRCISWIIIQIANPNCRAEVISEINLFKIITRKIRHF